jgi:hypothetical protein
MGVYLDLSQMYFPLFYCVSRVTLLTAPPPLLPTTATVATDAIVSMLLVNVVG